MNWLGLDIGGANIKVASSDGQARSVPFRFWIEHERLRAVLLEIIQKSGASNVAVTMTAELADCFPSRKVGVESIVDCVESVCDQLQLDPPIFAGTDVEFRSAEQAKVEWLKTAASNWAILAAYASRFLADKTGLVVDMGSTTTDIIPVKNGDVASRGKTDSQRLRFGELVYVGIDRTPVCSVTDSLVHDGNKIPIAREFFATVGDAVLVSGLCEEDPGNCDTADGRSKTVSNAAARLCRMVCEDFDDVGIGQAKLFSLQVLDQVERILAEAIEGRGYDPREIVVTGSGCNFARSFFPKLFPSAKVVELSGAVGNAIDEVAPALAVAVLASEAQQK